jgi:hypothetical protein
MEISSKFLAGNGEHVTHVQILSNVERNQKSESRNQKKAESRT